MKFYEWDRLRLDRSYTPGNIVAKGTVGFEVFRTYAKKVFWNAMMHKNMGLFYGDLASQRDSFFEAFAKQSHKVQNAVAIDLYDFTGDLEEIGENLEESYSLFNYHHYLKNFVQFLEDVVLFREEIRQSARKEGLLEANNRRIQIIFVNFDDKVLSLLNNASVYKIVEDLLLNSVKERIVFAPVVSDAKSLSPQLHKLLDWGVYLGSSNDDFIHDLYPDRDDWYYSKRQKIIGSLFDKYSEKFMVLHPLKFTASELYRDLEKRYDEEDELYKKFLESLDDGTD